MDANLQQGAGQIRLGLLMIPVFAANMLTGPVQWFGFCLRRTLLQIANDQGAQAYLYTSKQQKRRRSRVRQALQSTTNDK
ncbi:MAG: hypothetical protein RIQ71_2196 [Verrucomicrobiota bacterium]